jgi:hypothetical protein
MYLVIIISETLRAYNEFFFVHFCIAFLSQQDFDAWFNTNSFLGDATLVERLHAVSSVQINVERVSSTDGTIKPI